LYYNSMEEHAAQQETGTVALGVKGKKKKGVKLDLSQFQTVVGTGEEGEQQRQEVSKRGGFIHCFEMVMDLG
jgi:hypothetical protein